MHNICYMFIVTMPLSVQSHSFVCIASNGILYIRTYTVTYSSSPGKLASCCDPMLKVYVRIYTHETHKTCTHHDGIHVSMYLSNCACANIMCVCTHPNQRTHTCTLQVIRCAATCRPFHEEMHVMSNIATFCVSVRMCVCVCLLAIYKKCEWRSP